MAQTELVKQFPSNIYVPKIKILSASKNTHNELAVKVDVLEGILQTGDVLKFNLKDGTSLWASIQNVYVNGQQTSLAVSGETAEAILYFYPTNKIQSLYQESTSVHPAKVTLIPTFTKELASIGIAFALFETGRINKDRFEFLLECPILREKVIYLNENLLQNVAKLGLKALKDNWKKLAISTALGIFIYDKWSKLNKECLTKIGKEKLLCQRRVAERIITEIRRQAAECNTILDPRQKRKCLKEVEKKRSYWVRKLADLNEKIGKYKPT